MSLEQLIVESADDYYAALLASTHGWHDKENDPWPWLSNFVDILTRAYQRFEQRAASDRSTGTKQDRVREYVSDHAPQIFKIADVRLALPGVSDPTIRLTLEQLKKEGLVNPDGRGRSAVWVKAPTPGRPTEFEHFTPRNPRSSSLGVDQPRSRDRAAPRPRHPHRQTNGEQGD